MEIVNSPQTKNDMSLYDYYHSIFESMIADTKELRQECYKLRYQVYCVEYDWERDKNRYIAYKFERDEYDDHSVHALLRHKQTGIFVGTERIVLHPKEATTPVLPVHKLCAQNNLQIPQLVPLENMGEISRFCISKELRRRVTDTVAGSSYTSGELTPDRSRIIPAMSLGLISMLYLMARQNNVQQWCTEMEPFLIDLLARLGIHFDPVGTFIEYKGKRQINHRLVDDWVNGIAAERPDVWDIVTDKGRYCSIKPS